MKNLDLHLHSNYSDGVLSVPELVELIKASGIKYCALMDHNTVRGIAELKECLHDTDVQVIYGTELTAKYGDDEVHILTYDFDIAKAEPIVEERNNLVRAQKLEEIRLAIELSVKEGFEVAHELAPNEKQPVTLTLALDICEKKSNQDLFMVRHNAILTPEGFFYEYQAPGKSCAVERSGVTVEWIVNKFKGIATDFIVAHPFVSVSVVVKKLDQQRIIDLLRLGVTGLEVYHNQTTQEEIEFLKNLVQERSLHFTGGSDFHGKGKSTPIGQYGETELIPSFKLTNYEFLS